MSEDWKRDSAKIVERWARGDDPSRGAEPPTPTEVWVWLLVYLIGVAVGFVVGRWIVGL